MPTEQTECRRCGECCRKGGPVLHKEDLHLFHEGVLQPAQLVTLRKGETVRDPVTGEITSLEEEVVKLASISMAVRNWTCTFLDRKTDLCTIYEQRPTECRTLNCWAPEELEAMYRENRLTRADFIPQESDAWALVQAHEEACSYGELAQYADKLKQGDQAAAEAFLAAVRYDAAMREQVAEKTGLKPRALDFYFGRPITETMIMYDLKLERVEGGFRLRHVPAQDAEQG